MSQLKFDLIADDARYDAAVETVLNDAFGPGRFAKVSERVREAARLDRALSRLALLDGAPVGCCRIYRISVGDQPALFLGPLAVRPAQQGLDLGETLVEAALAACDAAGALPVIVVGQPALFSRFGFNATPPDTLFLPGPVELRRLQWRSKSGCPAGVVKAPRAAS